MANVLERVRAAITGDDAERLAKRRKIREQVAALQAIETNHRALGDQINRLASREDAAVAAHQKTCAPIQAVMDRIEEEITELILNDQPIGDALAQERAEALDKLALSNSKLEAEAETLKKMRRKVERERSALTGQLSGLTRTRNKLTEPGIACPELKTQLFVLDHGYLSIDKRVREAEKGLQQTQEALRVQQREREAARIVNSRGEVVNDPQPSDHERGLERECGYWAAEVVAAQLSLANCANAKQQIRAAILAE